jgi:hypothetical protein
MFLFKCLYYFFQKSKYKFWMNYVEVGKSCRCGYDSQSLFKLCGCWVACLKVEIVWVMFM